MGKDKYMKIAVILHLYYTGLWDWFLPYLKNINVPHDIYITLTENHHPKDFQQKIKSRFPNAFIKVLPNKGLDVGPFLWVMNHIIENGLNYKLVLKLHSKKSIVKKRGLGESWRMDLVESLLGSRDKFRYYCRTGMNGNFTMAASQRWVLQQEVRGYEQKFFEHKIKTKHYTFVGGTMFLINFHLIRNWMKSQNIYERFYDQFEQGYKAGGTLAHQFERVFGVLVKLKGGTILKC